ncbi:hypothetical protein [Psychrobacter phenylpyruvicus]|uniref:Lipoprotein n=1 Tax=Psychrobacter phenylpyruvicus TaxID=29432 RepID=A0A379LGY8_9GAMM|nr:hypothetical protein [Psychrobacter phenylpyruvicus]SUD89798.1 Uncharacterised protein [Psychrobacter phenylpyruvicus]
MFRIYLNSLIIISLCLTTSCVNKNPSHKLPIRLEVDFFINKDDKLCFKPDFTTANIESSPHKLDEITNVFFGLDLIRQDELIPIWEDKLPKDKSYKGLPICSEENYNDLLVEDNEYAFCMRGFEPKGSFNVIACPNFVYGKSNIIRVE